MVSDAELDARFEEVLGFVPTSGWEHCRNRIRQGKVYVVWHRDEQPKMCGFFDPVLVVGPFLDNPPGLDQD